MMWDAKDAANGTKIIQEPGIKTPVLEGASMKDILYKTPGSSKEPNGNTTVTASPGKEFRTKTFPQLL